MRVVLYSDEDFEPITVIDLNAWSVEFLKNNRGIPLRLAVLERISPGSMMMDIPITLSPRYVTIVPQFIRRSRPGGYLMEETKQEVMLLFTGDDESAMLLKSVFLPGQQRAVRQAEADGIAKGFLRALDLLGNAGR